MFKKLKLGQKNFLFIVLVNIIGILAIIGFLVHQSTQLALKFSYDKNREMAQGYTKIISEKINDTMDMARNLSEIFEQVNSININQRRTILCSYLKHVMEENNSYMGAWTSWDKNALDGMDNHYSNRQGSNESGRFSIAYYRENKTIKESILDEKHILLHPERFNFPSNEEEIVLNPYKYEYEQKGKEYTITSVIAPVKFNGAILGIVGIDIDIYKYQDIIGRGSPFDPAYGVLVSNNGIRLYHPTKKLLGKQLQADNPERLSQLLKAIKEGKSYEYDKIALATKEFSHLIFNPIFIGNTQTPWSFALVMPMERIVEPVMIMTIFPVTIAGIVIALIILILYFHSQKISEILETLKNETNALINSILDGNLNKRADTEKIDSEFRPILIGINNIIDAFEKPFNLVSEYIDRISKGDIPPKITEESKGDFNEINISLNTCIDAINRLLTDVHMLARNIEENKFDIRADAAKHGGDFAKIVTEVNHTLDNIVKYINEIIDMRNKLKESEEKYRTIFNNTPIGIFRSTKEGQFIDINLSLAKMLGYDTPAEVIANIKNLAQDIYVEPGKRDYIMKSSINNINFLQFENVYRRKDGTHIIIILSIKSVFDDSGKFLYFEGLAEDVTERRKAEDTINKQLSELETKNAELERFTYTVSHDLKSPLITIKGFIGHLLHDAKEGRFDRLESDVQRISNAADKMENLLQDLLELSRIGRVFNAPSSFSMSEIVKDALSLTHGIRTDKNIKILYDENMPSVSGDRIRIREVWQNLMENAVKYMGDQPEPEITIGCKTSDSGNIFYIKDNGIGIDPKYHKKIFGLFEKLEKNSEGTGIGLAIVKRIIELHNGNIWVESEGTGKGSSFCFTI